MWLFYLFGRPEYPFPILASCHLVTLRRQTVQKKKLRWLRWLIRLRWLRWHGRIIPFSQIRIAAKCWPTLSCHWCTLFPLWPFLTWSCIFVFLYFCSPYFVFSTLYCCTLSLLWPYCIFPSRCWCTLLPFWPHFTWSFLYFCMFPLFIYCCNHLILYLCFFCIFSPCCWCTPLPLCSHFTWSCMFVFFVFQSL